MVNRTLPPARHESCQSDRTDARMGSNVGDQVRLVISLIAPAPVLLDRHKVWLDLLHPFLPRLAHHPIDRAREQFVQPDKEP